MFAPSDFHTCAQEIFKRKFENTPDNARYRTSVGRFYYYIFLKIRDKVKSAYPEIIPRLSDGNTHSILIRSFQLAGYLKLSRNLKQLRDGRNKADYDSVILINKSFTSNCQRCLTEIEEELVHVKFDDKLLKAFKAVLGI